jgi:ATP-dependent protease ClpP protease subunit
MRHDYRSVTGYKAKLAQRIRNLNPQLAADLGEIRLPWYYIRNAAGEGDGVTEKVGAEIFIYDEIGGSFGVAADEFVKDLQDIDEDEITVRINSPGGSVFDAVAIYNALIQHKATITTRVDALAASAASIIAMAGDKVEMMVGSQLMIHDAMGVEMGNSADMREMGKFLDRQSDNLASIYANKGGDAQDWRALMLAETWMFANEAVDFGLADSVYTRAAKREIAEVDEEEDADKKSEEELSEEESAEADDTALENLMRATHRLTNRGYKYSGRGKAPEPTEVGNREPRKPVNRPRAVKQNDADLDSVIASLTKTLGRV